MIPLKDDNPTLHAPILTGLFIFLNVLVYVWQISGGTAENLRRDFRFATVPLNVTSPGEDPAVRAVIETPQGIKVLQGRKSEFRRLGPQFLVAQEIPAWLTLVTAMFMHGSWMHLIGNMLFLWVFGNNIEDAVGRIKFLIFYLVTGLAASAAHIVADPASVIPTLGASGAVSGILGGYLLLYPRAHVLALVPLPPMFLTTLRLPAAVFLIIWFVMQLTGVFGGQGSVAWWAHIGGFAAGALLIKLFETGEHRRRPPQEPVFRAGSYGRGRPRAPFGRGF